MKGLFSNSALNNAIKNVSKELLIMTFRVPSVQHPLSGPSRIGIPGATGVSIYSNTHEIVIGTVPMDFGYRDNWVCCGIRESSKSRDIYSDQNEYEKSINTLPALCVAYHASRGAKIESATEIRSSLPIALASKDYYDDKVLTKAKENGLGYFVFKEEGETVNLYDPKTNLLADLGPDLFSLAKNCKYANEQQAKIDRLYRLYIEQRSNSIDAGSLSRIIENFSSLYPTSYATFLDVVTAIKNNPEGKKDCYNLIIDWERELMIKSYPGMKFECEHQQQELQQEQKPGTAVYSPRCQENLANAFNEECWDAPCGRD